MQSEVNTLTLPRTIARFDASFAFHAYAVLASVTGVSIVGTGSGIPGLSKLQVENRAQAMVQALKRGLIALDDTGHSAR